MSSYSLKKYSGLYLNIIISYYFVFMMDTEPVPLYPNAKDDISDMLQQKP